MTALAGARLVTPAAAVPLLLPGDLGALGVIGQRDRLVVAVDAGIPARTVADLAAVSGRLTVATCPDDGINLIGFAAHKALRLAGVSAERLCFRYDERPFPALSAFADGQADVVINEAIMTPHWQRIAARRPVRYLPWGEDVLAAFAAEGWPSATVEAGYLPGLGQEWDGVVRRGAKLLHAFAEAVVPRVTLVTRKAYGGAYIAMNSRSLGATAVFAWPGAELAVMGASAAVNILHRKKLAAAPADQREALRLQLVDEQTRVAGGVERALEIGVVDAMVEPAETRQRIAEALAAAPPARGAHGNIPL